MEALKRSVYEEIIIESTDGSKTVDIAPGTVMIDYYEDIFSPTLTAKLQVTNDGASIKGEDGTLQSIYNGLPLRGGETVTLKIKGNNEQNPGMDLSFFVSSISNVLTKKKTESFTLNLVSIGAITNETSRVGRKYPTSNKISESVKDIVKNYLMDQRKVDVDPTQNPYGFIGNMRKPFTLLMWLASKSVPEKSKDDATAGYLFYETVTGFHFRSLDSIIDGKPVAKYYSSEIIKQGNNDYKIIRYSTSLNADVLGKLQRGAYCSYRIFFDPLTFNYTDPTKGPFKLEDYKSAATLGKDVVLPGNLGNAPSRYVTAIMDRGTMEKGASKKENADPTLSQSQALMRYNSVFSQKLSMTIPSNTNLEAGDIIECEFALATQEKNTIDTEQSGLYMIKELCHHFDVSGSYTSLTLIKDTFGTKAK
ncbi:hypothetical protein PSSM2_018 [Prochlorococcus phage P-SSM2]|jgi:hypothetical protein|uniref:Uncharacterized protein n=1 Tax=Prochlorococcus phage P-SSM2 TaxID=268746 RepID=Q58MY6_BPPRM|nr:tail protein [Prochlorococcus phage P-SSM2]AAX44396.1 hypothetical protein PSSM2_018 [Prochlorococcus phage P-SSM2]ACY75894.1 conserved hypothetical protein [Prochlorococcus phage P-SSM2]